MIEPRRRIPASERRDLVLEAAAEAFAERGYEATTTAHVARLAGVSQPYVVRLFGTKHALFLAVSGRCFGRVEQAFRAAAATAPREHRLEAMGLAYRELLGNRRDLRLQLHAYAACDDPEIAAAVRGGYAHLVGVVQDLSGASGEELLRFFAYGMLLNVMAATDLALEAGHAAPLASMLEAATGAGGPVHGPH